MVRTQDDGVVRPGLASEPLARVPLSTQVYEKVRAAILSGEIPEDSELNQVALARRFGVSTIPVREAIRQLQADGLVASVPYQRARVRALSTEQLEELLAIREELEVVGIRRHGVLLDRAQLEDIGLLNDRLATIDDGQAWLQGDWELHTLLLGGATVTADIVSGLRRRIHTALNAITRESARHRDAVAEHRRIIEALREGDADRAEEAMREHIRNTGQGLLAAFAQRFGEVG